jgi:hypothetical protein
MLRLFVDGGEKSIMTRRLVGAIGAVLLLSVVISGAQAATPQYIPGIEILLEVRTPQGDLRSFQQPGMAATYWTQDLPVVQGDRVTITPLVSTGSDELGEMKIRLDHKELADRTAPPWRVRVKTDDLEPGYHLVEVWAITKPPASKAKTVTTTFLVVPQNDPLLHMLEGEKPLTAPASQEEQLSCTIRSRDPEVEQEVDATSTAKVSKPTLFYVSAAPPAKEFFYTITRDGQVTYTSPRMPLATHVLLEPRKPDGQGQEPGAFILTAQAGDGEGRFGAPTWITVDMQPAEVTK